MIGFYLMIAAILGYYLGCVSLKKQYKFVFFSGVFMTIFEALNRVGR